VPPGRRSPRRAGSEDTRPTTALTSPSPTTNHPSATTTPLGIRCWSATAARPSPSSPPRATGGRSRGSRPGTVTTGLGRARGYGSPVLGAEGAVPFATADGSVGLAWTEDFARGGADDRARGRALSRALPGGRWTRLVVPPGRGGFGTPSGRRVQLLARASMPSGSTATSATASTVVVRRPPPVVRHLSAHRVGARIVVSWRTDVPVRRAMFFALASRTRKPASAVAGLGVPGAGGTRFRVVLGPDQRLPFFRGRAHWVRLYTLAPDRLSTGHPRLVPIR
jgi:hypothetical protein